MTKVVNLAELGLGAYDDGPDGHKFGLRSVTAEAGATLTGLSVYELQPGDATWPYHFELLDEEWLIVIAGEVMLRTPDGERPLRAGDVACFPAGATGAHAVRNAGSEIARFAMPSSTGRHGDATVYPDSGKFQLTGPGFNHRGKLGDALDYWDGEA